MASIVLDPGHGGAMPQGRSTPMGYSSNGRAEKTVTLEVARTLATALGPDVALTRTTDENKSLADRRAAALGANAFVSIHASPRGGNVAEVFVHRSGSPAAVAVGESLAAALGVSVRRDADLAILQPNGLPDSVGACLVEADFGRASTPEGLRDLVERLVSGLRPFTAPRVGRRVGGSFNLSYDVQLIPQDNSMHCWAASAAMVIGWRLSISIDPSAVVARRGQWATLPGDGLDPQDVTRFATAWGLTPAPVQSYSPDGLFELLRAHGPLWYGLSAVGPHVVVITGMVGDGTPDGTTVVVNDPAPVGVGRKGVRLTFRDLARLFENAAGFANLTPQVLYSTERSGTRSLTGGWATPGRDVDSGPGGFREAHGAGESYGRRPRGMTRGLASAEAAALVVTGGSGDPTDKALVETELDRLPTSALQALSMLSTKVVACRGAVTDYLTSLRGVQPRGWPAGSTWDIVPGVYTSATNEVVIATIDAGGTRRVPRQGEGHGAYNLVLHEAGHGLDFMGGAGVKRSDGPTYNSARTADIGTLSSYETQPGAAGREETFAESCARFYGPDPGDAGAHPNLHAWWNTHTPGPYSDSNG